MSPKNGGKGSELAAGTERSRPILHQKAREIQPYGKIAKLPIALDEKVCSESVENLNQILADTITLRDMYKKHHWQVAGHTFYQLHLLFDKHHGEQDELVDTIAERIQLLGGISLAMAADVAETTIIPRPPRGREEAPVQISRLLEAHETILKEARTMAGQAAEAGDDGTNDLLVSNVIRTNFGFWRSIWWMCPWSRRTMLPRASWRRAGRRRLRSWEQGPRRDIEGYGTQLRRLAR